MLRLLAECVISDLRVSTAISGGIPSQDPSRHFYDRLVVKARLSAVVGYLNSQHRLNFTEYVANNLGATLRSFQCAHALELGPRVSEQDTMDAMSICTPSQTLYPIH